MLGVLLPSKRPLSCHLRLVEAWGALPKLDSYAWRWVGYHMVKAGRQDDLRQLLLNFNYLQAKLIATNANALIADYDYLPEDRDLELVQSAIRLSTHVLVRDVRQLAGKPDNSFSRRFWIRSR
jgi:hypothetical protein